MIKNFYKRVAAGIALFTVELIFVWLLFIACVVVFFYISSQIVQGDELVRTPAAIGASTVDYVELESGVQPGDEVVISSIKDYEHLEKIKLK